MTAITDPVTNVTTITLDRDEVEALYLAAQKPAFSGSDEWDLNSAFTDGFMAALDVLRGLRDISSLDRPFLDDEDDDEA